MAGTAQARPAGSIDDLKAASMKAKRDNIKVYDYTNQHGNAGYEKSCSRKIGYPTAEDAQGIGALMQNKHCRKYHVYKCGFCSKYHVATTRLKGKVIEFAQPPVAAHKPPKRRPAFTVPFSEIATLKPEGKQKKNEHIR